METLLLALAPLVGVVLGASLSTWYARHTEVRRRFEDALMALADYASAKEHPGGAERSGEADQEMSHRLEQRLLDDWLDAYVQGRRSLAAVAPWCPEIEPYLPAWHQNLDNPEKRDEMRAILRRKLEGRLAEAPGRIWWRQMTQR